MSYRNYISRTLIALLLLPLSMGSALAAHSDDYPEVHKLVIQVSTDDPRTQTIALNNAMNLQKVYGMDNVAIEIVAYGPGLSLLRASGDNRQRVESLALQQITFSACGNTMSKLEAREGNPVELAGGVQVVPAGVARILELQEQGFHYLRP